MRKLMLSIVFAAGIALQALAGNTVTTVTQVSGSVTISDDVDYVITSTNPFAADGKVDITNTEHAVVIIKGIKPSKVISSYLKNHVYINGVQAVNNSNCQVKMYGYGAIIMPYAKDIKPLTVYSEQNFGGTAVNDFGLEHSGGYMNTLTEAKLNNKIRSFKLKRGYMVTFSTKASGRGYSRCFIADKEDLEVATLPLVLDETISSYRVFQWYNAKKAGLASDTRVEAIDALNASWCYDWGTGVNRLPDTECVPNHIYEDWPSSSACGSVTHACHMKTNNEPANSADDHPQSVETVLANWENLMRTGLRLCSPATHDGGWGWHNEFMNAIDERGWRCDLVDFHGYWSNWDLDWRWNAYAHGRPVWISEWVWGSSWNRDGFWANTSDPGSTSDANQTICYNGTVPILQKLNAHPRIERYAYWNSEAAGTHIYHDGKLTKLGEYYAKMDEGLGYDPSKEFIPKNPKQYDPSDLIAEYNKVDKTVRLTWRDRNGEYSHDITVQCKRSNATGWEKVSVLERQDDEEVYETVVPGSAGYKYRISTTDLNGKTRYTNETQVTASELEAGDEFTVGEETMYMGGNMLINGDFELGLTDWTNGKGEPLAAPYYEAVTVGGINGSAYLQAYGNSDDKASEQSVRKIMELETGACYYAQLGARNSSGQNQKISTSTSQNLELNSRAVASATTDWSKQGSAFKISSDKYLLIQLRSLAEKAQFDDIVVARLFPTIEEAMADALDWEKKRAEAFKAYNTIYPQLNDEIDQVLANTTNPLTIEKAIKEAITAMKTLKVLSWTLADAELVISTKADGYEDVAVLYAALSSPLTAAELNVKYAELSEMLQAALPFNLNTTAITGNTWEWTEAAQEKTQEISKLDHGFYAFEVKGATKRFLANDQHGFLTLGETTLTTPTLSYGVYDNPSFTDAEKWEMLATPYTYVTEKDKLTAGFTGTQWWRAKEFRLRHVPAYKDAVDESCWGTICLPYAFAIPVNTKIYEVVGITADNQKIAIREVNQIEAGTPYVYKVQSAEGGVQSSDVVFFESGDKAKSVKTNVNGLRGYFTGATQYPLNSLVLENGVWKNVTVRYLIKEYSGYIQKLTNLAVLDSWSGDYLPTEGLPNAIEGISADVNKSGEKLYTIGGTVAEKHTKGIKIKKGKKFIK